MGRPSRLSVRLFRIQAVFDHIQIEITHIHHAEIMNRMINLVELKRIVALTNLLIQLIQLFQRPLVDGQKLIQGHSIGIRVEVIEIAQNIPGGIPDLPVSLGQLLQNILRNADIRMIVGRSHPQPENIRAVLIHDLLRLDAVPQGFAHLPSFAVHNPSVGYHRLIGRCALGGHGGQERGLEPAPVLVGAL